MYKQISILSQAALHRLHGIKCHPKELHSTFTNNFGVTFYYRTYSSTEIARNMHRQHPLCYDIQFYVYLSNALWEILPTNTSLILIHMVNVHYQSIYGRECVAYGCFFFLHRRRTIPFAQSATKKIDCGTALGHVFMYLEMEIALGHVFMYLEIDTLPRSWLYSCTTVRGWRNVMCANLRLQNR